MVTFLSVLLCIATVIVVATVLLQPAKSGVTALGGSSQSIFGSTGGTTFLFRVTMASSFFILFGCLFLAWYKIRVGKSSFVDSAVQSTMPLSTTPLTNPTAPMGTAPAAPPSAPAPTTPAAPPTNGN